MIKHVGFDFAGTIAELSPTPSEIARSYLKASKGVEIGVAWIDMAYRCVDKMMFYSSVKTRTVEAKRDFYHRYNEMLFRTLGLTHIVGDTGEFFDYFMGIEKHWRLKEGVVPLFDELVSKNFSLYLLSNFDSKLMDIVADLGIRDRFEDICISQDIGYEKPDIRFYEYFLKKQHLRPEELFYIGDSYELDFLPATHFGIKTVLLDSMGAHPVNKERVESFGELVQLIEGTA